jgi:hypothetical protein
MDLGITVMNNLIKYSSYKGPLPTVTNPVSNQKKQIYVLITVSSKDVLIIPGTNPLP